MNVISLLAVIVASLVMLVKTVMTSNVGISSNTTQTFAKRMHSSSSLTLSATPSQHRSAVITVYSPNLPISLTLSAFLIISEVSMFRTYFARHWPLLSPAHGFVTLGLAMLVLGANMLGNLNKQATSQETMGLAFWRIVIGSGILVLILGFLNICAVSNSPSSHWPHELTHPFSNQSYIFRAKPLGVTARQVRSKGAIALTIERQKEQTKAWSFVNSSNHSNHASPAKGSTPMTQQQQQQTPYTPYLAGPIPVTPPNNITSKSDRFNPLRRFTAFGGRQPTLPSYHTSPVVDTKGSAKYNFDAEMSDSPSSKYSARPKYLDATSKYGAGLRYGETDVARPVMEISAPLSVNPQFAHLVRPESCMHPSRGGGYVGMI